MANVGDCGLRILRQGMLHTLKQHVPICSFIFVGQIATYLYYGYLHFVLLVS